MFLDCAAGYDGYDGLELYIRYEVNTTYTEHGYLVVHDIV
jgi:hypothetical protein